MNSSKSMVPDPSFINLLNDAIKISVSQFGVNLLQDLSEDIIGDEALAILVVNSEGLLEFVLQLLFVLFNEELCGQFCELLKLKHARAIIIDLINDFLEVSLLDLDAHHAQDVADGLNTDGALALSVERLEGGLQGGGLGFIQVTHDCG